MVGLKALLVIVGPTKCRGIRTMMIATFTPVIAAVGYSILYLLLGGGFGGAVLIFIIAKMFGK